MAAVIFSLPNARPVGCRLSPFWPTHTASAPTAGQTNTHTLVFTQPELTTWPPFRSEPAGSNKTGGPVGSVT